jgi:hypothetical protein
MATLSQYFRTFILAIVIGCFTVTAVYVPQVYTPSKALAAVATEGTQQAVLANTIWDRFASEASRVIQAGMANIQSLEWWRTSVLNRIGWNLAKTLLTQIVRDTAAWVNSGFRGSPAYIQNFSSYLTDVADATAGRFIQELGGPLSVVCSPFRINIQLAVASAYNRLRNPNLRRCTLTGSLQNIQSFIGGNFSQGGWPAWLRIVHNPQQFTQSGSAFEALAGLNISVNSAQFNQTTQLGWSRGFLSMTVCDPVASPTGAPTQAGAPGSSQGQQAVAGEGQNCRVVTPGQVISEQLNATLQTGNESLVEAKEIDHLIGAFLQQVAVQVLTGAGGLMGLGGGTGANARYTNPNFNINTANLGLGAAPDFTAARATMGQARTTAASYAQLMLDTIDRYENSFTTNPTVAAQADAAYNEARSLLPALERNIVTLDTIIQNFDQATTDSQRSDAVNRFTALLPTLPSQQEVNNQRQRWDFALSGLSPRTGATVDRVTIANQLAQEQGYLQLIETVIGRYPSSSQTPEQTSAYNEAVTLRPQVRQTITTLEGALRDYDRNRRREAIDDYTRLQTELNLSTSDEVAAAEQRWENAFGALGARPQLQ